MTESDADYVVSKQEKIHKALCEIFGENETLVNRWILVVETVDEDGKDMDFVSSDYMETWESIGLLRTVQIILEDHAVFESAAANATWPEDDDED